MSKKIIRLTESDIHQIIKESVKQILNEISADLADKAASKAYSIGREGFGKYGSYYDGIPNDSYHGKKFNQGETFLKYRNSKLGADEGYHIYYPNGGEDGAIVLKDANGNIVTKPCYSVQELEAEYNKLKNGF